MNRLSREKSPYLLQHKDNPVDWYPWSEEAFDAARRQDKPIFLSIGYATCHWCHVMAHESFEDEEVARLMNDAFINIKVDREERPDVDQIYMTVCQMATGRGGWPLTVVLTPDKQAFYVETYLPKVGRGGRPGMLELIPALKQAWIERREEVVESATSITSSLKRAVGLPGADELPTESVLEDAFTALATRYDERFGGFGSAPKFPTPHNLLFLLRYATRTDDQDALTIVTNTLRRMRSGGIFDQVGYGFHRYATDQRWLLPHFEKMLYDQALMIMAYTEAFQATGDAFFRTTAEEIIEYVFRDLSDDAGAFYSAEDADSEGEEGKFYVWTTDEVRAVLSADDARFVHDRFGMEDGGNFEDEATRRRTGANVLHSDDLDKWDGAERTRWDRIRQDLLEHRSRRARPLLDDKILTDWNGLMIAALAQAGFVFNEPSYTTRAEEAARFILDRLYLDGHLLHRYRDGEAAIDGFVDDYAFMIWAMLELYRATDEVAWFEKAVELQARQSELFEDPDGGGFFFTRAGGEELLVRQKEFGDGAIPSGNSVSLYNLMRLGRMTGNVSYEESATALIRSAAGLLAQIPSAMTGLLVGLDFWLGPSIEIVIAEGEGTTVMDEVLRDRYLPRAVVLRVSASSAEQLSGLAPFTSEQRSIDGRATAYVCRDFTCSAPVTTAEDFRADLKNHIRV